MAETSRNRGGRPRVDAKPLTVRLPPDQLDALDRWRNSLNEPPTRPAAVRMLLQLGLEAATREERQR